MTSGTILKHLRAGERGTRLMPRPRRWARAPWLLLAGVLATLALWTPRVARGEEPITEERFRQIEERVKQVDSLAERLRDTETEVGTLKQKLAHYENTDDARRADPEARALDQKQVLDQVDAASKPYGGDFDLHFWAWIGFWSYSADDFRTWFDGELQLSVTKTFSDRLTVGADVNFIESYGHPSFEIEQLFMSYLLSPERQTLLTVGKFNAPFGVEPRDIWFRLNSSPSLVFDAQPHDLEGAMITQPLGDSGFTLRPFIVNGVADEFDSNYLPSAGMTVEYQPCANLTFSVTNWGGPEYSGYDSDAFFLTEGQVTLKLPPRWTLSAEALYGLRHTATGRVDWTGLMALANCDLTDRWRVFGQWSFLNDPDGEITGDMQRRHALAVGVAYQLFHDAELRAEYRHDLSNTQADVDRVSLDLTFGF